MEAWALATVSWLVGRWEWALVKGEVICSLLRLGGGLVVFVCTFGAPVMGGAIKGMAYAVVEAVVISTVWACPRLL